MSDLTYQLITRKGPQPGRVFPLLASRISIGRDPMSDITLNDPEVSRNHVQLTQTPSGYQIQDMGSTNGTFIDGQQLGSEAILLSPGQEIAFGSGVTLTYELVEQGADEPFLEDSFMDEAFEPETAVLEDAPAPNPHYQAPQPSYPPNPAPAQQPLVPATDENAARKKKRTVSIIIAVILLLILCCCGFIAFMWFYGGDWLLQQLDLAMILPAVNVVLA